MKRLFFCALLLVACTDKVPVDLSGLDSDASRELIPPDAALGDVTLLEIFDAAQEIDQGPNRCDVVENTDEDYCFCHPTCCQRQQWYCPPRGTEIRSRNVTLDICDENRVPCDRSENTTCQPPQIIYQSDCEHVFDCPPGLEREFRILYDCTVDGEPGTQEVRCNKGVLEYGECITCTISEEICNNEDDDCDGEIDEGQRNACDLCGPLPQDTCDGQDNDCDGLVDEDLIRECETACERGIEQCDNGQWRGCTATQPAAEQCDGEDNDCDGIIDEGLNCQCPPEMIGTLVPCAERPLSCGMGFKTCECQNEDCTLLSMTDCKALCAWIPQDPQEGCDETVGIPVNPEVCNNFDEDCDDLIDENITRPCYTGPEGTLNVGVCQPGSQMCAQGQWYGQTENEDYLLNFCGGETVPNPEVCDGADNDCDGVTDFGEEIPKTDILFIVDWSGSMENYINAVRQAMNRFASEFAAQDALHWALIVGPKESPTGDEILKRETDIVGLEAFITAFSQVGAFENSTGSEMLRDALYLSIRNISANLPHDLGQTEWRFDVDSLPNLSNFGISWRPNADRIIVVFTDEEDQTYLVPGLTKNSAITAITATPNLKTHVFTTRGYTRYWEEYTNPTSGRIFMLSSNQEQMYQDLMSILDEICLPPQAPPDEDEQARASPSYQQLVSRYVLVSHTPRYDYKMGLCY